MYEVMYRKPSMIVAPGAGCSIVARELTRNVDEDGDYGQRIEPMHLLE